jgi:protein-disulfide isomerase-like protein with CxxC motif
VEAYFLTDPLCPWSWAMDPMLAALRSREDLEVRSVLTGWLPSLAGRGVAVVQKEWLDAAAKTQARIDAQYWERVAPATGLIGDAAVKAAALQGVEKGEAYLTALRRAIFERGVDVADAEALTSVAEQCGLRVATFRADLGVGRYAPNDVVAALDPALPLAESVSWFARRKMLRSWEALAEDIRNAERQKLASPAFHLLRGKKEAVLRGYVTEDQIAHATKSL